MENSFTRPPDGGPLYTETQWHALIKEPWNAASALLFAGMAVYWLYRLRGQWGQRRFLSFCLGLLLVGGIGGTLFHGLRVSRWFLLMDVLPILLIAVGLSLWLWRRLLPALFAPVGVVALFFLAQVLAHRFLPRAVAINTGYALMALMIVVPLLLVLRRNRWVGAPGILTAVVLFGAALFCRAVDASSGPWISIGTHWLWHTLSAASVWLLIRFLTRL